MKTSALFINHNSHGTILKSIQAVIEQDYPLEKIVVVDNASVDEDVQQIRRMFSNVEVIELRTNQGLSFARNVGLNAITSDMVLLVDDDVYLSDGALRLLVQAYHETNAVVVCPRIVLHPEGEFIQCDGASLHFSGMLALDHAYGSIQMHPPQRRFVRGFIGACLLVERRVLNELGNFDEDYFFYFEDMELSYRLFALGYKICCEERALALHDRGEGTANLSFRGSGLYPKRRAYFTLRNRWLTILIHYQIRTWIVLSPVLVLYELAAFLESMRRGWVIVYLKAFFSLTGEMASIWQRRARWMSKRKVTDRNILSGGDLPFSRGFLDQRALPAADLLSNILNGYWNLFKKWL